jgi:hypothetical protein
VVNLNYQFGRQNPYWFLGNLQIVSAADAVDKEARDIKQKPLFPIEEGILEAKTECYEKDKVKSPPFFRSFYDDFQSFF